MKKVLIIAACTVAALFVIHACTRESNDNPRVSPTGEEAAFEQLNVLIDNYNRSFLEENGLALTRSADETHYSDFTPLQEIRFRQLVKADLGGACIGAIGGIFFGWIGALIGGLLNGIISSVKAAIVTDDFCVNPGSDITDASIYYKGLEDGNAFDYVGVAHNIVIQNLLVTYGKDSLKTATDRQLFEMAVAEIAKLGYDVTGVSYNSAIITDHFHEIFKAIQTNEASQIADAIVKYYPFMNKEKDVLQSYMETLDQLDSKQLKEYATGYRRIVMDSNIGENSKNAINAAISTSIGSNELWKAKQTN